MLWSSPHVVTSQGNRVTRRPRRRRACCVDCCVDPEAPPAGRPAGPRCQARSVPGWGTAGGHSVTSPKTALPKSRAPPFLLLTGGVRIQVRGPGARAGKRDDGREEVPCPSPTPTWTPFPRPHLGFGDFYSSFLHLLCGFSDFLHLVCFRGLMDN